MLLLLAELNLLDLLEHCDSWCWLLFEDPLQRDLGWVMLHCWVYGTSYIICLPPMGQKIGPNDQAQQMGLQKSRIMLDLWRYGAISKVPLPPNMAGPKVGGNSREPALYRGGAGDEETVVEKDVERK